MRPRIGTVLFEGKPLEALSTEAIVRLGISQSPEGRLIFPRMTVQENLEMGAYLRNDTLGIKSDMEKALNLFPRLRERISQKGGTLSLRRTANVGDCPGFDVAPPLVIIGRA